MLKVHIQELHLPTVVDIWGGFEEDVMRKLGRPRYCKCKEGCTAIRVSRNVEGIHLLMQSTDII